MKYRAAPSCGRPISGDRGLFVQASSFLPSASEVPGDSLYAFIPAASPNRRQTADYVALSVLALSDSADVVVLAIALPPQN